MRAYSFVFAVGFAVAGSFAIAQDAKDPTVVARQGVMTTIAMNTKALGDMAGGKTAFDATAAEAAKAALIAAAAEIPARFEAQATDPASKAKPEIWTNWEDFLADATALSQAAAAVDTSGADTLKPGLGALGAACKDCHSAFRM